MKDKVKSFVKKEKVLCIAFILAVISMFLLPPDSEYINYIDFRTLSILFCLMSVMAGFHKSGVFLRIAQIIISKVNKTWQLVMILVFLCFFSSMFITNDVSLITFVPFTFVSLGILGDKAKQRLVVPVVTLQTIAANLGSMLTPIGNPHNLYLYNKADISFSNFILLMLPYVILSFILLLVCCFIQSKVYNEPIQISFTNEKKKIKWNNVQLTLYTFLFILDLLTVAKLIPYSLVLIITILLLLISDKSIFFNVDYYLLLTFVGFFIFIGNIERLPFISEILQKIVSGNVLLVSALVCQVISNVPTTLLLSRFTDNISALIIGVNFGGLGTLIASMASLISYRFIIENESQLKEKYFRYFTITNIIFLIILILFSFFLGQI